jgi:hypothetical protein
MIFFYTNPNLELWQQSPQLTLPCSCPFLPPNGGYRPLSRKTAVVQKAQLDDGMMEEVDFSF